MDFVAIDFETATSYNSSICSMGICVVENNRVVTTKEILIKPEPFEFNEYNIKIHGITPDMVENRMGFDGYWQEILPYVNDRLVIAHNAQFDIGGLVAVLRKYNLSFPTFNYLCTVKLSQKAYPEFPSHKLNCMADMLDISFEHHHAGADSYVCAMLMIRILEDFGLNSIDDIKRKFGVSVGRVFPGCSIGLKRLKQRQPNKA